MSELQPFIDHSVSVITADGRFIVGTLKGFDQTTNIILEKCHERVFSQTGTEVVPLGLYLIQGDNICIIGELDDIRDANLDLANLCADPIQAVKHSH
ncbi:hypothetical protein BC936DRAFT_136792 [Jimgerdemannia flammicorona]|uniref:LSM2-LSM8 complex subunit LSM8 n=1 Tax=Jimgerdemannia flammicorona TaxID=994334 RepID=A0A433CYT7_9FUNG|nr:hypothetical protein BC936DRAFT_136792 [Jimgerdemannia flammicorona]